METAAATVQKADTGAVRKANEPAATPEANRADKVEAMILMGPEGLLDIFLLKPDAQVEGRLANSADALQVLNLTWRKPVTVTSTRTRRIKHVSYRQK